MTCAIGGPRPWAFCTAAAAAGQLVADAAKTQIDIRPTTGEEVAAFIARVSALPLAIVECAKRALSQD
jgi:hypothetical protein